MKIQTVNYETLNHTCFVHKILDAYWHIKSLQNKFSGLIDSSLHMRKSHFLLQTDGRIDIHNNYWVSSHKIFLLKLSFFVQVEAALEADSEAAEAAPAAAGPALDTLVLSTDSFPGTLVTW